MTVSIKSLVPNVEDLLTLEAEELAAILLMHLNSFGENTADSTMNFGKINQYNFFNNLHHQPEYPGRQNEVSKALMEAWAWLESEGFLIRDADQNAHNFFLSRRAKRLKSREDFSAYRKASLLPKGQLHPLIASRVYPAFLRGEYDTAVFQAFREVEIAVRTAGKFDPNPVGKDLMREAFRPANPNKQPVAPGPLTDKTLPISEQESIGICSLGQLAYIRTRKATATCPQMHLTLQK